METSLRDLLFFKRVLQEVEAAGVHLNLISISFDSLRLRHTIKTNCIKL